MDNDSARYIQLAAGLRSGCGFARLVGGSCLGPEVLRTPGYPLFLAAIGNLRCALVVQAVLSALACIVVAIVTSWTFGFGAGFCAEALMALDVSSAIHSGRVMSDSLFQTLLVFALALQLWAIVKARSPRTAIASVLGGAALITFAVAVRPTGIVLPLVAALPVLFLPALPRRARMALAAAAFAIPAATIAGWTIRNYRKIGVATYSSRERWISIT